MSGGPGRPSPLARFTSSRAFSVLVLAALVFYVWLALGNGYAALAGQPDRNGDGLFNIADMPFAAYALLTSIGDNIRSTALGMRRAEIARFLQMSADPPNPFWSIFLSGFVYFLLWHFARKSLQDTSTFKS
jgi:hypothetical protein